MGDHGKSAERVVRLDSVDDEDMQQLRTWMNDLSDLSLWSGRRKQLLNDDFIALVSERARSAVFFVLRHLRTGNAIGFMDATLRDTDGVAEFQVYIDRRWRGRRASLQGIALFLAHLFDNWPVRKVYCFVYGFNPSSAHLVRAGGFQLEGTFREFVWLGQRYHDMDVWSLDRSTWTQSISGSGKGARFLRAAGVLALGHASASAGSPDRPTLRPTS